MAPAEQNDVESTAPAGGITSRRHFRLWLGLGLAAAVVAADQVSKWAIVEIVMDPPRIIPVLPIFNIVLAHNTGVSFGLFGDAGPYLLSVVALAVCGGLVWWLRGAETRLLAIGIGAIIGGAIGNVIDRVRLGAVIDFLDFHLDFYIDGYHFPAFNVADSAITIGVCLVLLDGLFAGRVKTG